MYWLIKNEFNEPMFCMDESALYTKCRSLYYLDDNKKTHVNITSMPNEPIGFTVYVNCLNLLNKSYTYRVVYIINEITQAEYETYLEMDMFEYIKFDSLKDMYIENINAYPDITQRIVINSNHRLV